MLQVESILKDYAIAASDGKIGTVSDFLFVDTTWKVRWLVVDTGTWLTERKVLVHPSAIGQVDHARQEIPVKLTKAQVEGSPEILQHRPVSLQMESSLYEYYGWDAGSGGSGAMALPLVPPPYFGLASLREVAAGDSPVDQEDPHLQSIAAITGYHIQASDGEVGHVESFLIDDTSWDIRYLIVEARNWLPGKHVLVSPYVVREISWSDHQIRLDLSRDKVKSSPPWTPSEIIDQTYEERLRNHFQWPDLRPFDD